MFCFGILLAVQTRIFSIDTFEQMVVLYNMCKDVFSQGLNFIFDCWELGIMFIFYLCIRRWRGPWRPVFWVSLEAVSENHKMEEVGHVLCSVFEFITKWSNRKVNAYWNLRTSFAGADTVMRWSLTGPWLNICIFGFHEKRGDNYDVSTWICV